MYPMMEIRASVPSQNIGAVAHIDCELLRTRPASEWLAICKREAMPYVGFLKMYEAEIEWSDPILVELVNGFTRLPKAHAQA